MLVVEKLSKTYGKQVVLRDVSFTLEAGSWGMLVGESGCGKSTLLKAIAGQIEYEGTIENSFKFTSLSQQTSDLLEECTAYENCILCRSDAVDDAMVDSLFDAFELKDCRNQKAATLSGGQKQRVSILRALLQCPNLLLLDEPTSQLDDDSANKIMQVLQAFQNRGMTILMVTHDLSLCRYATVVMTLAQGALTIETKKDPSPNTIKPSRHQFLWKHLLKRDLWAQKKHYLEMVLAISLSIPLLFLGFNIGAHYHQDLLNYLSNTNEAKEVYVNLAQPLAIDAIEDLLKPVDYHHIVIKDPMFDHQGTKAINGIAVDASVSGMTNPNIKKGAMLAISKPLASQLGLDIGDKLSLSLEILQGFEVIHGFRLQGPMNYHIPTYQTVTIDFNLEDIYDDHQAVISLSPRAVQMFQKSSNIAPASELTSFMIQLASVDEISKVESVFEPYLASSMGIVAIQSDINALKNGLTGQFAPFRYMSLILIIVLVATVLMVYKLCRQAYQRQHEILRQLNVPNNRIRWYHCVCFFILFIITVILSYGFYVVAMGLMNALFNPLDYTVLTPRLWPLVKDYRLLMVDVSVLKGILEVSSLSLISYVIIYILAIKDLKR